MPESADLPAKIVDALDRLGRARRHQRRAAAAGLGLTALQAELVSVVADGPPPAPTVGLLAAEVAVTQPTASDSLRALAGKGLVGRRSDHADRRISTVELTAAGRSVADDLARGDADLIAWIGELPPAVQATVFETLLTVIARMADTGAIDAARTCFTCRHHRHTDRVHRCALLEIELPAGDLRVNCADHSAA